MFCTPFLYVSAPSLSPSFCSFASRASIRCVSLLLITRESVGHLDHWKGFVRRDNDIFSSVWSQCFNWGFPNFTFPQGTVCMWIFSSNIFMLKVTSSSQFLEMAIREWLLVACPRGDVIVSPVVCDECWTFSNWLVWKWFLGQDLEFDFLKITCSSEKLRVSWTCDWR